MNPDLIRFLIEKGSSPEMIDSLMKQMDNQQMVNTEQNRGLQGNTLSPFGRAYNAPSRI